LFSIKRLSRTSFVRKPFCLQSRTTGYNARRFSSTSAGNCSLIPT
jgi:hypothetical protein